MRRFIVLIGLGLAAVAVAQEGDQNGNGEAKAEEKSAPKEEPKAPAGPFSKGRVAVRGSLNFDLNQSINLGGANPNGARVTVGANAGVGYFLIDRLSLDLDGRFLAYLTPTPGVALLEFTPGARYQVIDNLQVRVGVPIPVLPVFGVGVLGGASYFQPIGSNIHLVVGVDYTYYLTDAWRRTAPFGRIDIHGGVQTSF
jgi:hypothetical protein